MKNSTIWYILAGIVLVAFAVFLIVWRGFFVATGVDLFNMVR